ncbi:hypothetical protein NCPPB1935_19150 [Xanthomonas campestris pv. nigromaculans]|nr:hypothetical protein NCPPB1935_19150 [Xanthomonas campestris pv. nigromaculans]
MHCSQSCTPTFLTGPCPPTVAGPYAAWMPRKSLHGRTCGVSRDGGRARALQPSRRSSALETDASTPFNHLPAALNRRVSDVFWLEPARVCRSLHTRRRTIAWQPHPHPALRATFSRWEKGPAALALMPACAQLPSPAEPPSRPAAYGRQESNHGDARLTTAQSELYITPIPALHRANPSATAGYESVHAILLLSRTLI